MELHQLMDGGTVVIKDWDSVARRYVERGTLEETTFGPLAEPNAANDNRPRGDLSHGRLLELFDYDPDVGIFVRKVTTSPNAVRGDVAGSLDMHGYLTIRIDGRSYKAHRLAWFYCKGEWPDRDIDHKNRHKADNRMENLRLADDSENLWNTVVRSDCVAGLKGVHIHKVKGKPTGLYRVRIKSNGKTRHVGYFKTKEAAAAAYRDAANADHGKFARAS